MSGLRPVLSRKRLSRGVGIAVPAIVLGCCLAFSGCGHRTPYSGPTGLGDPRQGAIEIDRAACGSCHVIPGIAGAEGFAGPPLNAFGERKIVAGLLPNSPDNLARWIAQPQKIAPGNAMPDMGLSATQARDIAAYLERLR